MFGRPYGPAQQSGPALQPGQSPQPGGFPEYHQPPEQFGHQHSRATGPLPGGRPPVPPGHQPVPPGNHWEGGARRLAGFGARSISFLIDLVAPVAVFAALLGIGVLLDNLALIIMIAAIGNFWLFVFIVWNSCYQQGITGQSIGRRVARTKLVKIETGAPVGFGIAILRQFSHAAELGIGYLWPLWDAQRQTFADKIVGTLVVRTDR